MTGTLKTLVVSAGLALTLTGSGLAQNAAAAHKQPADKRAVAYYNFTMGHMYSELAGTYGYRNDYVEKAIEHYRAALAADPSASAVSEELTDLYMQSGKLRDAVTMAEDLLKTNPNNLEARRMLGRIYSRLIGDQQQNRVNETMVNKAIEQYSKVVEKEPGDADSWLMLGRLNKVAQNTVEAEKAYKKALAADNDNEFAVAELAQLYSELGDSKSALEMWKKLAGKDPRPRTLVALAQAYEQDHDYKNASEAMQRAVDAAPRDPELKQKLAEDLLLAGETDRAIKIYGEMAAADPRDARMQVQLSRAYRQKHDFAKAREAQNRALELEPGNLDIKYNGVKLLEAEGKTAEAITQLKGLLDATVKKTYSTAEQGNRSLLLRELGALYRMNEQYPEAVAAFRQVAEIDTDNAGNATADIIETWRAAKDFKKAEAEADAAVKKFPNDRAVKAAQASLLADMGKVDDAAAAMRKLIDGKNDREVHIAIAQIYDKAKRFKEEAEALDAAEKAAGDDDEVIHFLRGAMYERSGSLEKAEAEFRKVLDKNPENANALNYVGYMLADRNIRLTEARAMIVKALELEPNNGAYLDSLGWVDFRLGKLDEAESSLRQALQRTSKDPTVHDHLGDVLMRKGNLKDAIAQWEMSLREFNNGAASEQDPAEIAKIQKKLEGARVRQAKEGGVSGAAERR